jgi:hypothetical protein
VPQCLQDRHKATAILGHGPTRVCTQGAVTQPRPGSTRLVTQRNCTRGPYSRHQVASKLCDSKQRIMCSDCAQKTTSLLSLLPVHTGIHSDLPGGTKQIGNICHSVLGTQGTT